MSNNNKFRTGAPEGGNSKINTWGGLHIPRPSKKVCNILNSWVVFRISLGGVIRVTDFAYYPEYQPREIPSPGRPKHDDLRGALKREDIPIRRTIDAARSLLNNKHLGEVGVRNAKAKLALRFTDRRK